MRHRKYLRDYLNYFHGKRVHINIINDKEELPIVPYPCPPKHRLKAYLPSGSRLLVTWHLRFLFVCNKWIKRGKHQNLSNWDLKILMPKAQKMHLISEHITPVNYIEHDVLSQFFQQGIQRKYKKLALFVLILISLQAKLQANRYIEE